MKKDAITTLHKWAENLPRKESRMMKYFPSTFWNIFFSPFFLFFLFWAIVFTLLLFINQNKDDEINVSSEVIMERQADEATIDRYYQDFVR